MFKFFLYPFAFLFDGVTRARNYLYETGRRGSVKFEANVIAVGNLTVGGTGKTPHVEYLIRLLNQNYKIATLSRGYGRKTKGFLLADKNSTALSIGDEPFQYYKKFGEELTVAVGEERALAIPSILFEKPDTQVIILDDAYQHRAVRPLLSILLSDYNRPFYKDFLMPMGRLRESRKGANRADVVLITKCPHNLSEKEQQDIRTEVRKYTKKDTPIYFTGIHYAKPICMLDGTLSLIDKKVVLLTGLANPKPFIEYVRKTYTLIKHIEFPDHYIYRASDLKSIIETFDRLNKNKDHVLLTTEKDWVKLITPLFQTMLAEVPLFYIPIEVYFLNEKTSFDALVLKNGIAF
ncbi:MAG TPA: tetraacyldisaccharide 4'-kinase [Cytophagaceae bacterium]|nr:tetraacyldisaccharide 4'-kinase [Cytophagaceae bacterium]